MNNITYPDFFKAATGNSPYPWQQRLAEDNDCQSRLIDIPTGLGKTGGVALARLWNLLRSQNVTSKENNPCIATERSRVPTNLKSQMRDPVSLWPRRLVYCLPMRTLVEQTEQEISKWLFNLLQAYPYNPQLRWLTNTENLTPSEISNFISENVPAQSPIVLMGGEDLSGEKRDWDLFPEKPAILIGTQDMLLSRALNRGFGMSRYRWPMHFALLNSDCLWVMDETQLMGVGIETSAQLQGFRQKLGTSQISATWWMSATLDRGQLSTADFKKDGLDSLQTLALTEEEKKQPTIQKRTNSPKTLQQAPIAPMSDKASDLKDYTEELARFAADTHHNGTLTLLIVNRVERAQALAQALRSHCPETPVGLVHSRFRRPDRSSQEAMLHQPGDRIVVATQAVEAGVNGFEPKPNPGKVPPRRKEGVSPSRQAGARTHHASSSTTRKTDRRKPAPARKRTAPNQSRPLRRHPRRCNRARRRMVETTQSSHKIRYGRYRDFQAFNGAALASPKSNGAAPRGARIRRFLGKPASLDKPSMRLPEEKTEEESIDLNTRTRMG